MMRIGRVASGRAFFAVLTACFCLLSLGWTPRSAQALYLKENWTFRAKPALDPEEMRMVGNNRLFVPDTKGVIHFLNADTGERLWRYSAPAGYRFAAAKDFWFVSAGTAIFKLDYETPTVVWNKPTTMFVDDIAALGDKLAVKTSNGEYRRLDPWSAEIGAPLSPDELAEFKSEFEGPAASGPEFEVSGLHGHFFGRKFWVSKDPKGQETLWEYESEAPLARTAAEVGDNIAMIDYSGGLHFLNREDGKNVDQQRFSKIVDTIFWDDQRKDYFEKARMISMGGDLLVANSTGLSRIGIQKFPSTIGRKNAVTRNDIHKQVLLHGLDSWYKGQNEEAIQAFDAIIEQKNSSSLAHLFRGLALLGLSRTDEALQALETAYRTDPHNPDIHSNLIQIHFQRAMTLNEKDHSEEILQSFSRIRDIDPTIPVPWVEMAEILVTRQDYQKAAETMEEAFEHGLYGPDMRTLAVSIFYLDGQLNKALALASDTVRLFPGTPQLHALMGRIHYDQGAYQEAILSFQREPPRTADPGASQLPRIVNAGREYFLADALHQAGHSEEAADVLADFLNAIPNRAQFEDLKKKVAQAEKNAQEGEFTLSEAAENWLKQGTLLEIQSMIEYRTPALLALTNILAGLKDFERGRNYLDEILAYKDSLSDSAYSATGYLMTQYGYKLDEALEMTKEKMNARSEDVFFIQNYAVALWNNKKYNEAEEYFNLALEIDPKARTLHFEYARMLEAQGYLKSAQAEYELELALNPEFEAAKDAVERLSKN